MRTRAAIVGGAAPAAVFINETGQREAITPGGEVDETSPPQTTVTPFDRAPYFTYLEM